MRDFTLFLRTLLFLVIATATASTAKASSWYAYNNRIVATPTGAGQVYASQDPDVAADQIDWQDSTDVELVSQSGYLYGYAKPATGWLFAGWTIGKTFEDGTYVYGDSLAASETPGYITLTNGVTDDPSGQSSTEQGAAGMMPLDPNNVIYGNFARVVAQYYPGQSNLGSFTVSPISNNFGDKVTLTAIADSTNPGAKFDGWMLNGEYVSKDPVYTITVTDTARYVPHFSADNAWDVDFGAGSALPIYSGDSADVSVPNGFSVMEFFGDSVKVSNDKSTMNLFKASYNVSALTPAVIVGKGKATLVRSANNYPYAYDNNIARWTENGVNIDTLDTDHSYYTFDAAKSQLNLLAAGTTLPARTLYIALPDSTWDGSKKVKSADDVTLSAAPAIIYTSDEAAIVNAIKAVKATGKREAVKGIFTLDGRRLKAINKEGLYIVDGKKVLYKEK